MKTNLCRLLGIEHSIIAAPMGPDLTGPDFVAAVSNAGGLGILQAQLCPPPLFRQEIRRVRALTGRSFGVNLILHFPVEDHVAVCLEERVPVLSFFWGDPTPYVERAHAADVKVFHQVGSVAEAKRAAAADIDVIVAQGVEAGGPHRGGGLHHGSDPASGGRGVGEVCGRTSPAGQYRRHSVSRIVYSVRFSYNIHPCIPLEDSSTLDGCYGLTENQSCKSRFNC